MNIEFHTPALTMLSNICCYVLHFLSLTALFSLTFHQTFSSILSLYAHLYPPSIAPVPVMVSGIISQPNIQCVPFQRDPPANTADYQENILGRRLKVGNCYLLSSWADGRFWFCRSAWECPRFNWFLSVLSVSFFAFVSYTCYLQHP